ncbi:hypothetical protein NC652_020429 [Populus alba x Populus x berolinensis]|nr:hypothetical protein NC652_020429 [Populus alba x Populus x berolinensis]
MLKLTIAVASPHITQVFPGLHNIAAYEKGANRRSVSQLSTKSQPGRDHVIFSISNPFPETLPCAVGSHACETPSQLQYAFLHVALAS